MCDIKVLLAPYYYRPSLPTLYIVVVYAQARAMKRICYLFNCFPWGTGELFREAVAYRLRFTPTTEQ